jgi:hypothetical protein
MTGAPSAWRDAAQQSCYGPAGKELHVFPNHHHYVPVLKWKRAEQAALRGLAPATKARLTPLLEIVPIPTDLETGDQTKTLEEHCDPGIEKMVSSWGTSDVFFIDPAEVASEVSATGMDGATYVFSEARQNGLRFVPVTGLLRAAVEQAAALAHAQNGLCLRVVQDDLARATLPGEISTFVSTHGLAHGDVDIIIDLGAIRGQSAFVVSAAINVALATIPSLTAWRTLTVVATAFPENMGVVQSFGAATQDRVEWQAWTALFNQRHTMPRMPSFGDFGIQHPTGVEGFDPRYMQMAASIRYTLLTQWLLLKGQSTKALSGSVQYPQLVRALTGHAQFFGATHCPGCGEAAACAAGAPGKGSPEAWRRIGTAHHLAVVTAQLGALPYP